MKTNDLEFHYVTGSCPNCGANQFRFDEEQQTFVCEYCGATVYQGKTADHASKMKPKSEQPKVEPCTEQLHSNDSVDCSTNHRTRYDVEQIQAIKLAFTGFILIGIGIFMKDLLDTYPISTNPTNQSYLQIDVMDLILKMMCIAMPIFGILLIVLGAGTAIVNFIEKHK